jgi:hypothetical protein
MLDLYGRSYTLVRFDPGAETASLQGAARNLGVPLSVVDVDDDAITRLYERKLVLVRPDGFVAWRGDTVPDDALDIVDTLRGA